MAQRPRQDFDGAPTDLDAAERHEATLTLRCGEAVRVAIPSARVVVLCQSQGAVNAALAGRIPRDAVRLDRGATR